MRANVQILFMLPHPCLQEVGERADEDMKSQDVWQDLDKKREAAELQVDAAKKRHQQLLNKYNKVRAYTDSVIAVGSMHSQPLLHGG